MAALEAGDSDAIPAPIVELPPVASVAIRRLRAPADYPAMNAVAMLAITEESPDLITETPHP